MPLKCWGDPYQYWKTAPAGPPDGRDLARPEDFLGPEFWATLPDGSQHAWPSSMRAKSHLKVTALWRSENAVAQTARAITDRRSIADTFTPTALSSYGQDDT